MSNSGQEYDLCVIGGGPAGYAGAMRALDFGKKVILIEREKIGGAGLHLGALWSKSLWEQSMKIFHNREDGIETDVNWRAIKQNSNEAVIERKFQMNIHMKLLQTHATEGNFHYLRGTAKMASANTASVFTKKGKTELIRAKNFLIATGSRPRVLPEIAMDEKTIVSSNGIEGFEELPGSLVILGAGVVGCEFATIFSNLGKTKVFLIDKAERILPFEDEDVSQSVTANLEKNGVVVHKGCSLASMKAENNGVRYTTRDLYGKENTFFVEKALISVGRVPNTENLGLDDVGIQLDPRGFVLQDDTQTSLPNVYVAGDVCASMALVNIAEREARHAVVRMFGPPIKKLIYNNISTIMFLNPEVASVGIGEKEADEKNIAVRVAKIDYSLISRAIAMGKTYGFFKIIISDDEEKKVLGMRAVGEHASSAIQAVNLLIYLNMGIEELANMMHPHPSIIEGIQECMRMLLQKSIYKPSIFGDKLKCYRRYKGKCEPLTYL